MANQQPVDQNRAIRDGSGLATDGAGDAYEINMAEETRPADIGRSSLPDGGKSNNHRQAIACAICSARPASDLGVISGDSGYPCRSWPTTLTCGPSHVTYRRLTFLLP